MKLNHSSPIPKLLAAVAAWAVLTNACRAVDFHVTTAQELQNALTLAAANGADDNIYLAAGYYTGNFNFNSAENRSLLLQGETGTTNTQITLDGAATGRDMNLANSGTGNFTVRGLTFMRNCGSTSYGALRIAGGTGSTLLVDSCRFLSPTNASASGMGLDIASGQNVMLTNSTIIGKTSNSGYGIQIQGMSGNVTIGGCQVSTNGGTYGIYIYSIGGGLSLVANNINANGYGIYAYVNGSLSCLNNNVFGNGTGTAASLSSVGAILIANNFFKGNNGVNAVGGCSAVSSGTVTLSNNVFIANSAVRDANGNSPLTVSAYLAGSSLAVIANSFIGNGGAGAGALRCGSPATISRNIFSGNSSSHGGLLCEAQATIIGNTFSGNSGYGAGGLCCATTANVTVQSNTFIGNSCSQYGGGAYFSGAGGSVSLSANVFKQNNAAQSGGAIYANVSTVSLVDNLVVKNSQTGSGYQGGGIYVAPSSRLTMINNTVSDNSSTGNGGGLAVSISGTSEILDVYNNIIWGNSASGNGADVWLAGTGSKKTFLFNDVHGMYGVWDITANLLDVAPAFFDPVNADYHLRSTSACLNAGTNGAPSIPATDLDGNARTNGIAVDLGCYEFNNTRFHPADVNQDWVISAAEYTNYAAAWKNNQPWPTAPTQIPADYVTRAGYLQNQGGTYHNDGAGAPLGWKPGAN